MANNTNNTDRFEALDRLTEIKEELSSLIDEAESLVAENFPAEHTRAQGYWIAHIKSAIEGPYATCTLSDTIEDIEEELDDLEG